MNEKLWTEHIHFILFQNMQEKFKGYIKQLYKKDSYQIITNTYINKESIERKIMEWNTLKFEKAYNPFIYKDGIYNEVRNNNIWDRIINRSL